MDSRKYLSDVNQKKKNDFHNYNKKIKRKKAAVREFNKCKEISSIKPNCSPEFKFTHYSEQRAVFVIVEYDGILKAKSCSRFGEIKRGKLVKLSQKGLTEVKEGDVVTSNKLDLVAKDYGHVVADAVIGHVDDVGILNKITMSEYGLKLEFPQKVLNELENIMVPSVSERCVPLSSLPFVSVIPDFAQSFSFKTSTEDYADLLEDGCWSKLFNLAGSASDKKLNNIVKTMQSTVSKEQNFMLACEDIDKRSKLLSLASRKGDVLKGSVIGRSFDSKFMGNQRKLKRTFLGGSNIGEVFDRESKRKLKVKLKYRPKHAFVVNVDDYGVYGIVKNGNMHDIEKKSAYFSRHLGFKDCVEVKVMIGNADPFANQLSLDPVTFNVNTGKSF